MKQFLNELKMNLIKERTSLQVNRKYAKKEATEIEPEFI